ncbi:MAG: phosphatase PAP2 family protein [Gemmatimonadaceae bacterium]
MMPRFVFPEHSSTTERFTASFGVAVAAAVISANGFTVGLATLPVNIGVAALVLFVLPRMRRQAAATTRFLGHASPLLVFFLFYKECGLILSRPGVNWRDASLGGAERVLQQVFPDIPAGAGELLSASYMSYVPFIIAAAILVFRGDAHTRGLETLVRRISFAWALCFAAFVLFPVLGPRFADAPAQEALLGTGPFSALALFNQRYGMLYGGAFPSAHIAASVIALGALSLRQRLLFLPLVLSIFVSVVALRYHYRIDVVAGIAVGLGAIAFDRTVVALSAASEHSGSVLIGT